MTRFSAIQFCGVIITWAIVHAIMWQGEAKSEDDVPWPVRLVSKVLDQVSDKPLKREGNAGPYQVRSHISLSKPREFN